MLPSRRSPGHAPPPMGSPSFFLVRGLVGTGIRWLGAGVVRMVTVRQMMTPAPAGIRDRDTVSAAARRLRDLGADALPVCRGSGEFLGMWSRRDIVDRCVAVGLDPMVVRVGSLVHGDDVWIDPEHPADDTVLAVPFLHADGLPVVRDGRLVGMVGLVDVAAHP